MRADINLVRNLMVRTCQGASVPKESIDLVVDHYLNGELRGRGTHGIAKFCYEAQFFAQRQGQPHVVREHGALAVIDAQREIGPVSAAFAAQAAVDRAHRFGVGLVGMINTQRYGILSQWSESIAARGFIGIVMNTSRPEATPHGGRTPILGVNPLSFSLPTTDDPLTADMSTTQAPMGLLWEARRGTATLPEGAFVDEHGTPTQDPDAAQSAVIFGDHRGFALSLLLQALTGSMFGFPMGTGVDSTWTTGYTFLAADPSFGHGSDNHLHAHTRLRQDIQTASMRDGAPMRVPGQASRRRSCHARSRGHVEIAPALLRRLQTRAAGDLTSD